jgi:hypothetical protein
MQNFLREQPGHLKSFDLLAEVLDMFVTLGKVMPVVRQFGDFEATLMEANLAFLVECMQGPCPGNQESVALNAKSLDACKNVLSSKFPMVGNAVLKSSLGYLTITCLAAMMESRGDDKNIHEVLLDQIPTSLLKRRLVTVMKVESEVARLRAGIVVKEVEVENEEGNNGDKKKVLQDFKATKEELEQSYDAFHKGMSKLDEEEREEVFDEILINSAAERKNIYGVWSELSSVVAANNAFQEETLDLAAQASKKPYSSIRGEEQSAEEKKLLESSGDIRSVEIYWNGATHRHFFTLPKEWQCFSSSSKMHFLESAEVDNAESRMKSLIEASDKIYEEMQYQERLNRHAWYRIYSDNFLNIKKFTYCLVLLLNANVMISTFEALEHSSLWDDMIKSNLSKSEELSLGFAVIVLVMYGLMILFLAISYAPLQYQRSQNVLKDLRAEGKFSAFNGSVVVQWLAVLCFFAMLSYIHASNTPDSRQATYVEVVAALGYLSAPFVMRAYLVAPDSKILQMYCACFDTLSFPPLRNHAILFAIGLCGTVRSYWFTFLLLDILTMSPVLQSVVKSVTFQWQQLVQTFSLFLIVICCYTALAFYIFGAGSFIVADLDENGNPTYDPACSSLIQCFLYTVYIGMRTGDIDEAMGDAADPGDFGAGFNQRMIYDLSFFIILGVLLFDMVTGIILDAFSALREEIAEREGKMNSETFVSGLSRSQIEEMEGTAIDFKELNNVDQNWVNYLFFIIYIKERDESEFTGLEQYVHRLLEEGECSWVPLKTSWSIEKAKCEVVDERDAEEKMEEQVESLASLESTLKSLMAKANWGVAKQGVEDGTIQ